jgi:hypothetical protein
VGDVTAFTDAEQAVCVWLNDAATGVSGTGNALTNGCHQTVRGGSPGSGTFAVVTRLSSTDHDGGMPVDAPRLSFTVYGPSKERVAGAALALCAALRNLSGRPYTAPGVGRLMAASRVALGYVPDGPRPRYVVDADLTLAPA